MTRGPLPESAGLATFGFRPKERFLCHYGLGDEWRHQIRFELILDEEERRSGFGSEMNIGGVSADQIATRRARRILLDERAPESPLGQFSTQRLNEDMLEMYVSGRGAAMSSSGLVVIASPIPQLASEPDDHFIDVARLMCAFMLITTNTVERISRLEMRRTANGVQIEFAGYRARVYSNQEPFRMEISGVCPLS